MHCCKVKNCWMQAFKIIQWDYIRRLPKSVYVPPLLHINFCTRVAFAIDKLASCNDPCWTHCSKKKKEMETDRNAHTHIKLFQLLFSFFPFHPSCGNCFKLEIGVRTVESSSCLVAIPHATSTFSDFISDTSGDSASGDSALRGASRKRVWCWMWVWLALSLPSHALHRPPESWPAL